MLMVCDFFGTGHLIKGNFVHDLVGTVEIGSPHIDCFQTWGPANNITFDNNLCLLVDTPEMNKFTMIERSSGRNVYNLVFKNNLYISQNTQQDWIPIQISNNSCSSSYPIRDIEIYNNTFAAAPDAIGDMALLLRCINGITIKNNLVINLGGSKRYFILTKMF